MRKIPENTLSPRTRCDVCGSGRVALNTDKKVNQTFYLCYSCRASVYCHGTTNIPLGYMATKETRGLRTKAHGAFDALWRDGPLTRHEAYLWLAEITGRVYETAHIGWLRDDELRLVTRKSIAHRRKLVSAQKKDRSGRDAINRRYTKDRRRRKGGGKWKPK